MQTDILEANLKFVNEIVGILAKKQFKPVISEKVGRVGDTSYTEKNLIAVPLSQTCAALQADDLIMKDEKVIKMKKIYMELIHLGAIKIIVTFKFEKKAFELDLTSPGKGFGATNIVYSVFTSVANISDSPLAFKELIIVDTFVSMDTLTKQIVKNYARQGVLQFYKLFGSSDLIGNPVGLVDKLGTGVFEFFNEPRKGILKGPEEFVGGIGKGVKSLVTNVVSGSFGSVSKITGSLYGLVKNVSGDKEEKQVKKPDHVFDGIYLGFKGGVGEIVGGVTGVFTKPIDKTKQEGAKGFFKGLGSGLMGAISAPVTATLKVGSTVSEGVATTATKISGKGSAAIEGMKRFRPPRYINLRNQIETFDEEMAAVNEQLEAIEDGKYSQQT